jgi:hypothetical protein
LRRHSTLFSSSISVLALAAIGCGGTDPVPSDAGVDAPVATSDGGPADGARTGGSTMMCGTMLCMGGNNLRACCPGEPTATSCGVSFTTVGPALGLSPICATLEHEGALDEACPDTTIRLSASMSLTAEGCCRPDGQCGYDFSNPQIVDLAGFDLGCITSGILPDAGTPASCTPGS